MFKKGHKKKAQKTITIIEDWPSTTSENMRPPPKCRDVKKTPRQTQPQKTQLEAMRKSTQTRQSTLAEALRNPVPINSVEQK